MCNIQLYSSAFNYHLPALCSFTHRLSEVDVSITSCTCYDVDNSDLNHMSEDETTLQSVLVIVVTQMMKALVIVAVLHVHVVRIQKM